MFSNPGTDANLTKNATGQYADVKLQVYIDHLTNITRQLNKTRAARQGKLVYVLTTPSPQVGPCAVRALRSPTHSRQHQALLPIRIDAVGCAWVSLAMTASEQPPAFTTAHSTPSYTHPFLDGSVPQIARWNDTRCIVVGFFLGGGGLRPMHVRTTCFGPCVVAAAYAAVGPCVVAAAYAAVID